MNDQQQPYGPHDPYGGYEEPRIAGYDAYGRPVYQQQPAAGGQGGEGGAPPPSQDQSGQGYGYGGYDPYAQPQQAPGAQQYDPYAQQYPQAPGGGYGYGTGQQGAVDTGRWPAAAQEAPAAQDAPGQPAAPPHQPIPAQQGMPRATVPRQGGDPAASADGEYATGEFAFVEEPDEDSEDVIDWLKFTESRSERREEARRRGKRRLVALVVALAVVLVGGAGYLWQAGLLPGTGAGKQQATAAGGAQKRDVIVVHLHDPDTKDTSTALLVDNQAADQGDTVLLPNSLMLTNDDGTTSTLAQSVAADGSDGTRDAIGNLLGTQVSGTWRLDTPYLENLVDLVGNIDVDTDTDVPDGKKGAEPVVHKGRDQTLSGAMAVAYATYRAPGESDDKQLERFGQVLQATLRKISSDPKSATTTVQTLEQILDPSLTEQDLGTALAGLAAHAKDDRYKTVLLPVQSDGTLGGPGQRLVKSILGGSVSTPDQPGVVRIGVENATGNQAATESARVALVNAGYTFVDAGTGQAVATTRITYADAKDQPQAVEVAKTLDLPTSSVSKGSAGSADVSVVLGEDYKVQDYATGSPPPPRTAG